MNEIKIFSNPQFGEIRTAMTANGEPMFCLADVCKVLDLTPSNVAQRLTEWKSPNRRIGRTQNHHGGQIAPLVAPTEFVSVCHKVPNLILCG